MIEIINKGKEITSTNFFDLNIKDAFLSLNSGTLRLLIPTCVLKQIDVVIYDLEYFELEKNGDIYCLYLFEKGNDDNPFLLNFEPNVRDFNTIKKGKLSLIVYTSHGFFKQVKGITL